MKSFKAPAVPLPPRQLNLLFDHERLIGLSTIDQGKARQVLAQILMQAAGLIVEQLDDDEC